MANSTNLASNVSATGCSVTVIRASERWSSEVDPCENWLIEGGKWIILDNGGPYLDWANEANYISTARWRRLD